MLNGNYFARMSRSLHCSHFYDSSNAHQMADLADSQGEGMPAGKIWQAIQYSASIVMTGA